MTIEEWNHLVHLCNNQDHSRFCHSKMLKITSGACQN